MIRDVSPAPRDQHDSTRDDDPLIAALRTAKGLQMTPPPNPRPPAVESERTQPPLRGQFVHLGARRSGFRGRADVIVDHHPAAVGEPVSITIAVAPNVGV